MFESLIGLVAIIALFVIISRQQSRIGLIERELGALRSLVLSGVDVAPPQTKPVEPAANDSKPADAAPATDIAPSSAGEAAEKPLTETEAGEVAPGPWAAGEAAPAGSAPAQPAAAAAKAAQKSDQKPDIETALGTRWAVWVGGIALALGGLFLIRYTIEAGIFGPGVRLSMAAMLGLVLVAVGEFIRRTGFRVPVQGVAGAYIPAILTAAGAFILFGTVYAAHGVYGFIGPALAFTLLGAIGVATIVAALVHGQALAGIGLLGAVVTPMLVAAQAPNPWALFGYLAIVLAATATIARLRDWKLLMAAAFVGTGLWTVLYMTDAPGANLPVILFINAVTLAVLAFVWLGHRGGEAEPARSFDWPSIAPGFFVGLSAMALFVDPAYAAAGDALSGAALIAALVAVALYRPLALALLHAAGLATVLVYLGIIPPTSIASDLASGLSVDGLPAVASDARMLRIGIALGLVFIGTGFWAARRFAASAQIRAASWAAWGVVAPLVILLALWFTFGNLDRDLVYAAVAALLVVVFATGAEWIARGEEPPLQGGAAVSFALGGAAVAGLLMLYMAFGSGWTTMLLGAAAIVPALATRWRAYPVLGWISVGAVVAVLGRVAFDPTIVGAEFLSRTPVFNWLLPGYGVPALAFGFAAWQLARTTNGRPRLAMEAGAALFALLTIAILVRHAMHDGVIDTGAATLAEQAIYTLIALGAGAILVAIDMRSPSSVLRHGSLAAGVVSVAFVLVQHFLALNPLFTDESTGRIPVFNLLFLAYLLPAIAAGGLALYSRDKRPKWYAAMLALVAALLAFVYATLSVRRLFKGEFIGLWSGLGQLETYTYSALWLIIGVALLTAGVWLKSQVLRIASAALISVAVLKVFLFDMSELEGVLRALSFIGLGAVLIGIGLFYQRLLTRAAKSEAG
ncbi:putative membrane protein [Mesorhizobium robiniae]|uniref:Membrane protein n=1 Tax=Mesorhizobium robiniae TaxID=559315 RepID=A0ABV2GYL0_9HYPH